MIVGFFPQLLLSLWKHECKRVIADRFTKPEDVEWFDQTLATLVGEEMVDEHKGMVDLGADRYFVDFLRDAPEATGARPTNVQTERDRRHHVCLFITVCSLFSQGKSLNSQTWIRPRFTSQWSHLRV